MHATVGTKANSKYLHTGKENPTPFPPSTTIAYPAVGKGRRGREKMATLLNTPMLLFSFRLLS